MTATDQPAEQPLVQSLVVGPLDNNVLLVADRAARAAMVVDPALGATEPVLAAAREIEVEIALIVNTHGHWDHVADNAPLSKATGAPIAIHEADAVQLTQPASAMGSLPWDIPPSHADRVLTEGEFVQIGSTMFTVLQTPGHTPGSICLYSAAWSLLVSGDTLFAGSYGRYDLPGGDAASLRDSLARLGELPAETRVYPGHGGMTTIGTESWLPQPSG
ncbi:MAG: MBL fold hydrolase [Dehalococcoidia bacterium]|nr:MBL fold hydrolase [Dehalococcoidia bacterium]